MKPDPLRSLKLLGALSIAVPVFIYLIFGAYRFWEASDVPEQRVNRSLRVAHEHASKVVASAEAMQDRLLDQLQGKSMAELRQAQPRLHALLAERIRGQPQIQSIWIIGADGHPIATSRFPQAPPELDFTDRPYFQAHRAGTGGRYVSAPFLTRTTRERIMDLSVRFDGPDGKFAGVINLSLLTKYFEDFYADLVADEPGLAVNLFRESGEIYTRWPRLPNQPERMGASSPVLAKVAQGVPTAQLRGVSSTDGQDRLIAYRKIGDYPLYVGTGMNISAMRADIAKDLAVLFALGVPPFAALFFTSRFALRRTRESLESADELERETHTRMRAEEALRQAQKLEALGRLTGGVAHDFNNALMVISNNAFLLRRHVSDAGGRQLDSIGRAVDSATKLTRQLLAFSRRQVLVPEQVRLQDRLPEIKELIAPVLGSQIRLGIDVAPDTRPITIDLAELDLALLNLGINARDAMPGGGSFTISARNARPDMPGTIAGEAVLIEATDTGSGIDEATLGKVFEPFYTTKPVGHGTGLGLSQVYGLCQRAGGAATIRSVVGQGTTVSLYFPAADGESAAQPASAQAVDRNLDKSVLLVEDNNDVAMGLIPLLEALGCSVTRVDRAAGALEWLAARTALPDLVLTDVVMPGEMNGLALARHLRDTHPNLPVLLMTGYAEQLDAIEKMGFEVLPKPCSADVLSAAIARVSAPGVRPA
ncbi:hybrid sensor histidine kinase/response regulator [Caenimonas aquaedulcis]|uniref:histidine kinase n=1 Tax=Caenimonas aquaedulcis TaxID=2793270 RepID=A0A931H8F5_9BURK|nr:response regulator [Caenimonas aquaedulcis]MBG9390307.1 response regulator [Caenimonas aquaedulcis]